MDKSSIIVLCGTIASGKSTYCKQFAEKGWVIINDDSIVNLVHGGLYQLYNPMWKPLYKSIENHILHSAIIMNKSVIIDRGLDVSIKSRSRWIAIARSLDVPVKAVVFEQCDPEIHAQRRTNSDNRGHDYDYWLRVAKAHIERYEPPTLNEGFDEISEWKFHS